MHVEIKAAMFNFVTDDKSHGQPNKYFRTHFFSYKRFAPNFTKMEIKFPLKRKGCQVVSVLIVV